MTIKEKLHVILKIENSLDLKKVKYNNVNYWPFLRNILGELDFEKTPNTPVLNYKGRFIDFFVKKKKLYIDLKYVYSEYKKSKKTFNFQQADVLFLTKNDERNVNVGGKGFSKFADSLKSIVSSDYSFSIIEYNSIKKDCTTPYNPFVSIERNILRSRFSAYLKVFFSINYFFSRRKNNSIISIIENEVESFSDEHLKVEIRLYTVFNLMKEFELILKRTSPKIVFMTCFYSDVAFALTLACKKVGIKCVELQHGQQGDNHLMYTHWPNIHKEGCDMMPDCFWMWGEGSKLRIDKWLSKTYNHKSIVGGNPWLAYSLNVNFKNNDIKEKFIKYNKKVLISLQYSVIPDFILKTIKNSPQHIWFIRLHPRFISEKGILEHELNNLGLKNIELNYANELNIHELFKFVDIQITFWSTVAYEALYFGVNTIIAHVNGKEAMADYIEKKIFIFSTNENELLKIIDNPRIYFNKEEENYIEVDKKRIIKSVQKLIEGH